jgi:CO/xanthine dehydrogenase Mo-binding subunit
MSVGRAVARDDAYDKVTGRAAYPADLIRPEMLHLAAVFARRPHARIVALDATRARDAAGVVAVLTAADVPYNRFGLDVADQQVLCDDVVRYVGDRVALVVATSPAAARRAAALVHVTYDDLPLVIDPLAAMADDAPRVHADRPNLMHHRRIVAGDVESALDRCDVVVEATFTTSWQEHAYLQPEAGTAFIDEQGRLVVVSAGQWIHDDRRQIAKVLGLPEDRVVVRNAQVGGAFGGREDLSIQPLVALAAWTLKRPVAMQWTREESILGHHKRHPFTISATWGAQRDGTIVAARSTLIADGGAYASSSSGVLNMAITTVQGPYAIPNVLTDGYVCYTNNLPSGAFRGFGAPQGHFVAESMIARLADALGLDATVLRRANLYREGNIEPTGEPLPSGVHVRDVFERCLERARAGGASTPRRLAPAVRRGTGIACGMKNVGFPFGYPEGATASVELFAVDGGPRARVRTAAAEVGQGTHMALRQIAAEALSLPLAAVELVADDTSEAPDAGSASASRLTLVAGRAVKDAAEAALREQVSWSIPCAATVTYRTPPTTALDARGHGRPNFCYGYVAQAVEVEVDCKTGVVRIVRVVSAHDVGRAINPQLVEGQIEGAIAQAVGYALTEEFRVERGRVLTPNFTTYLLPTALDVPHAIETIVVEIPDPNGPYGARGVAEMALVPFAAAVADAIHDATGAWVCDLPFTPERVLRAIAATRAPVAVP